MTIINYTSFVGIGIVSIFASTAATAACHSALLEPSGFPGAATYFGVHLQGACTQISQNSGAVISDSIWKFQQGEECKNYGTWYEVTSFKSRSEWTVIACSCDNRPASSNMFDHTIRCQYIDKA